MGAVHVRGEGGVVARALAARLGAMASATVAESRVVVDLHPAGADRRARWAADLEAGRHVLSASMDPDDAVWAHEVWHDRLVERGQVFVPNAGAGAVLGDLLGVLATQATDRASTVHISHLVAERGGLLGAASRGLRAEVGQLLGAPTVVVAEAAQQSSPLGELRRLAWFARPVGPHHAANVWSPEVVTLARQLPDLRTVQGHLAMTSWRAETTQALGNAARFDWVRTRALRRMHAVHPALDDARWATVAEAEGDHGVARAWANGRDLTAPTAAILASLATRLAVIADVTGVPAPAQLVDPGKLLDELAASLDLRWSVVRPPLPA